LDPESTFLLRLSGVDGQTIREIREILAEGQTKPLRHTAHRLVPIVMRSGLSCAEIEEYVREFRPKYLEEIERLKRESREWQTADEARQSELMDTFTHDAVWSLDVVPYSDVWPLFEYEPKDLEPFKALVQRYGYDAIVSYWTHLSRIGSPEVVPARRGDRQSFDDLLRVGLARRPHDVPVETILQGLDLRTLKALVGDSKGGGPRSKRQAIAFLLEFPDIRERLHKEGLDEAVFELVPLPNEFAGANLERFVEVSKYAWEVASLLAHTYMMGFYAAYHARSEAETVEAAPGLIMEWELTPVGDGATCRFCQQQAEKGRHLRRRPRVPFHIGCRCTLIPEMKFSE
jgi:hypothetical protein